MEPSSRPRIVVLTTDYPRPPIGPSFLLQPAERPAFLLDDWLGWLTESRLFLGTAGFPPFSRQRQRVPGMTSGFRSTAARSGVSIDGVLVKAENIRRT